MFIQLKCFLLYGSSTKPPKLYIVCSRGGVGVPGSFKPTRKKVLEKDTIKKKKYIWGAGIGKHLFVLPAIPIA